MNHINLLRKSGKKNRAVSLPSISPAVLVIIIAAVVVPLGIVAVLRLIPKKASAPQIAATPAPSPFKPSTYSDKSSIVEEVVGEIGSERAAKSNQRQNILPYTDLSFLEKVNYEVLFAKNVFAMFSRAVPAGIGLKTLEIDNFQTLYAVGIGNTRELISSTFIALKSEKLELLPKPFSYITPNDGEGYRFVVTCKIANGLDLADPFQANDYLPSRDDLPIITRKVKTIAQKDSVFFGEPKQLDAERIGLYGRFRYQYSGTTTYNNFVKFLLSLHTEKVVCAFKKIDMKARNGSEVTVDTEVLFTVKE